MLDWLAGVWNAFVDLMYRMVLTVYDAFKDLLLWAFDEFMGLSIFILDGVGDLFSSLDVTQYVEALPVETKGILALTGIGDASSMIVAAIIIRLILQLIPFVRLGS